LVDATPVVFFDDAMLFPAPATNEDSQVLETSAPQTAKADDAAPAAGAQKQPDNLTGQLADSLMLVFKTFTGR